LRVDGGRKVVGVAVRDRDAVQTRRRINIAARHDMTAVFVPRRVLSIVSIVTVKVTGQHRLESTKIAIVRIDRTATGKLAQQHHAIDQLKRRAAATTGFRRSIDSVRQTNFRDRTVGRLRSHQRVLKRQIG
jgi:hypothetical protein